MARLNHVVMLLVSLASARALAQGAPPAPAAPTGPTASTAPTAPTAPTMPTAPATPVSVAAQSKPEDHGPKQPKRGDFDAGGQVRLPNGPDEMGKFATYNWIAFDAKARYYLLDSVTVDATAPLAVIHPDMLPSGVHPKMFGGLAARFDAKLPKLLMMRPGTEVGLTMTLAYMHEGAMLFSDKDYPLFTGNFEPGFSGGLLLKVKLSSLLDFSLVPQWVIQDGKTVTGDSYTAVQIPTSLLIKLASVVQLSADLGVYTGPGYSFSGDGGGRITAGGSLTVKIGPILAHAGAGVASLLTGGEYPTIGDSMYIDLNVKYAK